SGSGKSTLLHLIGALDIPTAGHVEVMGQNIHALSAKKQGMFRNKHLGFVYQFHHLLPEFTALENVAMPLLIAGQKPTHAKEQAHSLIAAVNLSNRAEHKPGELSGGEKQRIALARALITRPDCVLADEPTGNLDHRTAEATLDLMMQLNSDFKTSFVVVTHDQTLAAKMHRTLVLESGALVAP
ncbi:MAG: ATP-binding cassette domain-containing protein, partial [Enterobacterales bacterium]|nr:ATP-binding cassette domain-containing protein [Enterobacterales bacterium]